MYEKSKSAGTNNFGSTLLVLIRVACIACDLHKKKNTIPNELE